MEIKSERMNEVECSGMVTWKFIAKSISSKKVNFIGYFFDVCLIHLSLSSRILRMVIFCSKYFGKKIQ